MNAVIDISQPIEPQLLSVVLEKKTLSELSTKQAANLLFADYIKMYLPLTYKPEKQIIYDKYCDYTYNSCWQKNDLLLKKLKYYPK